MNGNKVFVAFGNQDAKKGFTFFEIQTLNTLTLNSPLFYVIVPDDSKVQWNGENYVTSDKLIFHDVYKVEKIYSLAKFVRLISQFGWNEGIKQFEQTNPFMKEFNVDNIFDVPENRQTQKMWEEYFNQTKNIYNIPHKFRNYYIWSVHYHETKNVEELPKMFQRQFMWIDHFNKNKDINKVPPYFRDGNMYKTLFKMTRDISQIPKYFQTQKMWNSHFDICYSTNDIPPYFITPEMLKKVEKKENKEPTLNSLNVNLCRKERKNEKQMRKQKAIAHGKVRK